MIAMKPTMAGLQMFLISHSLHVAVSIVPRRPRQVGVVRRLLAIIDFTSTGVTIYHCRKISGR
jgi:hypothetical protein